MVANSFSVMISPDDELTDKRTGTRDSSHFSNHPLFLASLRLCVSLFLQVLKPRIQNRIQPPLVKIKVLANPGRQSWGARTGKDAASRTPFALRFMEQFQPVAWTLIFIVFLGCLMRL